MNAETTEPSPLPYDEPADTQPCASVDADWSIAASADRGSAWCRTRPYGVTRRLAA